MWYARDIKDKIITRLTDTTYGIEALISTINNERGESTSVPYQIGGDADTGQYPLIFVDLGDSTITNIVGSNSNSITENFNLEITAVLLDNNIDKLKYDCENYIEAIIRCLQGWNEQSNKGDYICQASGIQRADIDTMQDQTKRAVTVIFTVYNNQI